MGNLRIIQMTNAEERFYLLVGPFLSQREIVKELGFPIWDDPNKLWFVALSGKRVVGFAAIRPEANKTVFCSAYVLPEFRKQGIYRELVRARLEVIAPGETVHAMATQASKKALQKAGLKAIRQRGKYFVMEREKA